jgi:hypothetical protein
LSVACSLAGARVGCSLTIHRVESALPAEHSVPPAALIASPERRRLACGNQANAITHGRRACRAVVRTVVDGRTECVKVIGSSDEVHVVDALAMIGDEGRESLRKAAVSWQISFDPRISEWGNPPKGIADRIHRSARQTGRTETSK